MKRLTVFLILIIVIFQSGCTKKADLKVSYDPFTDIKIKATGYDGQCTLVIDNKDVITKNYDSLKSLKNKDLQLTQGNVIKQLESKSTYEVQNNGTLKNGDKPIIKLTINDDDLASKIDLKTSSMDYEVKGLEKAFLTKDDLLDNDYKNIESKVLSNVKAYFKDKATSDIILVGQYIIPYVDNNNVVDENKKSVLTVYTTVLKTKMTESLISHDYVYVYQITGVNYDQSSRPIFTDDKINYITRSYQVGNVKKLLSDNIKSINDTSKMETVKQNEITILKSINDLPNDSLASFNQITLKNLQEQLKKDKNTGMVIYSSDFYKCYLITYNVENLTDNRNSLVLIYKIVSRQNEAAEPVTTYYFSNFDFFLFDDYNNLVSYANNATTLTLPPNTLESDIIKSYKSGDVSFKEIILQ